MSMQHYNMELSIVFHDHGYQQALALQAKTGVSKSKILKIYPNGSLLINSDGSPSVAEFNKHLSASILPLMGTKALPVFLTEKKAADCGIPLNWRVW